MLKNNTKYIINGLIGGSLFPAGIFLILAILTISINKTAPQDIKLNGILALSALLILSFFTALYLLWFLICNSRINPVLDIIENDRLKNILKRKLKEYLEKFNSKKVEIHFASIENLKVVLDSPIDDFKKIKDEIQNGEERLFIFNNENDYKKFLIRSISGEIQYQTIVTDRVPCGVYEFGIRNGQLKNPEKMTVIKDPVSPEEMTEVMNNVYRIEYQIQTKATDKGKSSSIFDNYVSLKNCAFLENSKSCNDNRNRWFYDERNSHFKFTIDKNCGEYLQDLFQQIKQNISQKKSMQDEFVKELENSIKDLEKQRNALQNTKQQNPWKLEGFTDITLSDIKNFSFL